MWSRDVAVGLNRFGDLKMAAGDPSAALAAYGEALDLARGLAARDAANAGGQRDLAVSFGRIGDARAAAGDREGARAAWQESHSRAMALAAQDPENAIWSRDAAVASARLAELDPDEAPAYWAETIWRMEELAARGALLPGDAATLDAARRALNGIDGN